MSEDFGIGIDRAKDREGRTLKTAEALLQKVSFILIGMGDRPSNAR